MNFVHSPSPPVEVARTCIKFGVAKNEGTTHDYSCRRIKRLRGVQFLSTLCLSVAVGLACRVPAVRAPCLCMRSTY